MQEVERAGHDLAVSIERLTHALDAVGDDRRACRYVPFKAWGSPGRLSRRVSSAQEFSWTGDEIAPTAHRLTTGQGISLNSG